MKHCNRDGAPPPPHTTAVPSRSPRQKTQSWLCTVHWVCTNVSKYVDAKKVCQVKVSLCVSLSKFKYTCFIDRNSIAKANLRNKSHTRLYRDKKRKLNSFLSCMYSADVSFPKYLKRTWGEDEEERHTEPQVI